MEPKVKVVSHLGNIDDEIEQLKLDVANLNSKYNFEENNINNFETNSPEPEVLKVTPYISSHLNSSQKKKRYKNLPQIDIEHNHTEIVHHLKISPQISKKWKEEISSAPDINEYYIESKIFKTFNPLENIDFQPKLIGLEEIPTSNLSDKIAKYRWG